MILFLNDVAGSEIILILVLVLIFFGSKSIPGLARTMGRTIRQVKDASADIQSEIKKSANEMKGDLNIQDIIHETAEDIKRPLDQHAKDLDNAIKYDPEKTRSHLEEPTAIPDRRSDEPSSGDLEENKLDQPTEDSSGEIKNEE